MRVYTELQAQLQKVPKIGEYTFTIFDEECDEMEEWVVAGINFPNKSSKNTLFSIFIYKFGMKFQRVDVNYKIDFISKEIQLIFVKTDNDVKQSDFGDNAGNLFLSDIINKLIKEFNKKKFQSGNRDIFEIIKQLEWAAQLKQLEEQRKELQSNAWKYVACGVLIGIVALLSLGFASPKKNDD